MLPGKLGRTTSNDDPKRGIQAVEVPLCGEN